jgi:predicted amidohydrolase YtcJ
VTPPTENPGAPRLADLIVKAGRVYSMNSGRDVHTALAVRDGWIVAVSDDRDGLDALASDGTHVVDDPELTLLPAFFDIHEHLLDSARNLARVRLEDAHSMDELITLIRGRAAHTPKGEWIQTSNGWNESNLAAAAVRELGDRSWGLVTGTSRRMRIWTRETKEAICWPFRKPSDGLEPSTPSLPWRCSTS